MNFTKLSFSDVSDNMTGIILIRISLSLASPSEMTASYIL